MRIHDELKVKLVEDWASVTQKGLLVKLPRDPTVSAVLQNYAKHSNAKGWCSSSVSGELVERLKEYFRADLERRLLCVYQAFLLSFFIGAKLCAIFIFTVSQVPARAKAV